MKVRKSLVGGALALSLLFTPSVAMAAHSVHQATPKAGQFCKNADSGKVATAANGSTVICKYDAGANRNRWVVK